MSCAPQPSSIEVPDDSHTGTNSLRSVLARAACRAAVWTALIATLGGCSSEQVYNAAQGWRRNECYKIGDLDRRDRCLKDADLPYDAYRAASGRN